MRIWTVAGLGALGMAIASRVLRRAGTPAGEESGVGAPGATMHERDWELGRVPDHGRRYFSPGQFLHHQRELLAMLPALGRVYLMREIPPAFREEIMIVTAMSNACSP